MIKKTKQFKLNIPVKVLGSCLNSIVFFPKI